jgi:hypothetical protein
MKKGLKIEIKWRITQFEISFMTFFYLILLVFLALGLTFALQRRSELLGTPSLAGKWSYVKLKFCITKAMNRS